MLVSGSFPYPLLEEEPIRNSIRCSLSHAQLFSTLCLTVPALWCGSGLVYILVGQGVLQPTELRSSLVPGLAAFTLALLIIGSVAVIVKKAVLALIAIGISLACAHQIAGLSAAGFGQSATAANYLLVCLVGVYFGFGRLLSTITNGKVEPPGKGLKRKAELKTEQKQRCSDAVSVGLVMNLLSASVLACPLLGVVHQLSTGHVPWLWTAEVFQLPVSPVPFPVVFSVLFFILALSSCQKNLLEGLYQLFFAAYCIAIAAQPQGFFQGGSQGTHSVDFDDTWHPTTHPSGAVLHAVLALSDTLPANTGLDFLLAFNVSAESRSRLMRFSNEDCNIPKKSVIS
ncbi:hypothetical protein Q8A73_010676 [Channa argus]|nr:hypothetical protein Q8A73_010676 [Channa argus]